MKRFSMRFSMVAAVLGLPLILGACGNISMQSAYDPKLGISGGCLTGPLDVAGGPRVQECAMFENQVNIRTGARRTRVIPGTVAAGSAVGTLQSTLPAFASAAGQIGAAAALRPSISNSSLGINVDGARVNNSATTGASNSTSAATGTASSGASAFGQGGAGGRGGSANALANQSQGQAQGQAQGQGQGQGQSLANLNRNDNNLNNTLVDNTRNTNNNANLNQQGQCFSGGPGC